MYPKISTNMFKAKSLPHSLNRCWVYFKYNTGNIPVDTIIMLSCLYKQILTVFFCLSFSDNISFIKKDSKCPIQ